MNYSKKLLNICNIKKKNLYACVYMVDSDKETYENNDIEVIVDGIGTLWLNEKHIEETLGHKNLQSSQTNMTQYIKSTDMN